MSVNGCIVGCTSGKSDVILKPRLPKEYSIRFEIDEHKENFQRTPPKHFPCNVDLNWLTKFRGKKLNICPIESNVDSGHLGWRSESPVILLKVHHARSINAMFALNWFTGSEKIFENSANQNSELPMAAIFFVRLG